MENQQTILPPILPPPRNNLDDIPQHIFPRKRKALQVDQQQSRKPEQAIAGESGANGQDLQSFDTFD